MDEITEKDVVDVGILFIDYLLKHEPTIEHIDDTVPYEYYEVIKRVVTEEKTRRVLGFKAYVIPWLKTETYSEESVQVLRQTSVLEVKQRNVDQLFNTMHPTYHKPTYSADPQVLYIDVTVYEGDDKDHYVDLYERVKELAESYIGIYNNLVPNWITLKITKHISMKMKNS